MHSLPSPTQPRRLPNGIVARVAAEEAGPGPNDGSSFEDSVGSASASASAPGADGGLTAPVALGDISAEMAQTLIDAEYVSPQHSSPLVSRTRKSSSKGRLDSSDGRSRGSHSNSNSNDSDASTEMAHPTLLPGRMLPPEVTDHQEKQLNGLTGPSTGRSTPTARTDVAGTPPKLASGRQSPASKLSSAATAPVLNGSAVSVSEAGRASETEAESELGADSMAETENTTDGGGIYPKQGGFGRRDKLVPHVDGMASEATARAAERENAEGSNKERNGARLSRQRAASAGTEWGAHFWCVITDPKSGSSFFANPQTGECVWEVPSGTFVLPPNPEGEWWELMDEQRGLPYFYHTQTNKSQWVRPQGFVIPLTLIQESTLGRRFSKSEFGQDTLAALAAAESPADNKAAFSSAAFSAGQRKSQPPPPPHSPSIDQILSLEARRRSMSNDLVAQAMAAHPTSQSLNSRSSRQSSLRFADDRTQAEGQSGRSLRAPGDTSRPNSMALSSSMPGGIQTSQEVAPPGGMKRSRSQSASGVKIAATPRRSRQSTASSANDVDHFVSSPPASPSSRTGTGLAAIPSGSLLRPQQNGVRPSRGMRHSASETTGVDGRRLSTKTSEHSIDGSTLSSYDLNISAPIRRERDPAKRLSPLTLYRNGQPPKPIPIETRRLSTGEHRVLPPDLRKDIEQFAFEGYALRHFSTHKIGIFRRKVSMQKMMHWQKTALNAPLLTLDREMHRDATKIFKIIQRIMGDRVASVHTRPPPAMQVGYGTVPERSMRPNTPPSDSSPPVPPLSPTERHGGERCGTGHSGTSTPERGPTVLEEERWVLEKGCVQPALRDEIFAQTIKQLMGNPSMPSAFKGWQFLCVLLVTFPPSVALSRHLQTFIEDQIETGDESLQIMARYCASRLSLIRRRGPRGKAPSIQEIESASDAAFNPSVFGRGLGDIMRTQQETYPEAAVPIILPFLADAMLAMDATKTEGIFRVAGDMDLVTELKVRIDRGHYSLYGLVGLDDVHVPASVFKLWLRELEEPLIPSDMYNACVAAAEQPSRCIEMVMKLPTVNRRVVLFVISFLQIFCASTVLKDTKMSVSSLALIYAPNFFRCESTDLPVVYNNARYESLFVQQLLLHLPCRTIDPDFVPIHGEGPERGVPASSTMRTLSSSAESDLIATPPGPSSSPSPRIRTASFAKLSRRPLRTVRSSGSIEKSPSRLAGGSAHSESKFFG